MAFVDLRLPAHGWICFKLGDAFGDRFFPRLAGRGDVGTLAELQQLLPLFECGKLADPLELRLGRLAVGLAAVAQGEPFLERGRAFLGKLVLEPVPRFHRHGGPELVVEKPGAQGEGVVAIEPADADEQGRARREGRELGRDRIHVAGPQDDGTGQGPLSLEEVAAHPATHAEARHVEPLGIEPVLGGEPVARPAEDDEFPLQVFRGEGELSRRGVGHADDDPIAHAGLLADHVGRRMTVGPMVEKHGRPFFRGIVVLGQREFDRNRQAFDFPILGAGGNNQRENGKEADDHGGQLDRKARRFESAIPLNAREPADRRGRETPRRTRGWLRAPPRARGRHRVPPSSGRRRGTIGRRVSDRGTRTRGAAWTGRCRGFSTRRGILPSRGRRRHARRRRPGRCDSSRRERSRSPVSSSRVAAPHPAHSVVPRAWMDLIRFRRFVQCALGDNRCNDQPPVRGGRFLDGPASSFGSITRPFA